MPDPKQTATQYACSVLDIKAMDEAGGKRVFRGIATTPTPDRTGDIVEPKGAEFQLPIPLCWMHDSRDPVGWVTSAKVTDKGIEIEGELANIAEPASLKDRLDTAWAMLKAKLVRGLSIGFKPLESARIGESYSYRYVKWLWLELSPVTVAANGDCSITAIKSLDQAVRRTALGATTTRPVVRLDLPAAAGATPDPGASGPATRRKGVVYLTPERTEMKSTIAEDIAHCSDQHKAANAAVLDIVNKCREEGRGLDEHETEQRTQLLAEAAGHERHIAVLRETEQMLLKQATSITPAAGRGEGGPEIRGTGPISVRRNLPPGTAFTRYVSLLAMSKGNLMQAEVLSKRYDDSTPEVGIVLKTAVAAGTTSDTTWAAPLVQYNDMVGEFIELLRPQTILGRLTALRRVPFNIRIPRQTAGTTGTFVGEGLPAPVKKLAFDNLTLPWAKASTICVITAELARFSNPSAEALVRQDLMDGIAQYLDKRLIDPAYAGVANVSPASLTNGVTPVQASGSTLAAIDANVRSILTTFANAELGLQSGAWVMSASMAIRLSMMRTNQDFKAFPDLTMNGGTFYGLPVIVSNNVAPSGSPGDQHLILIDQSNVLLADDGQLMIDVSTEASIEMDDAPAGGATSLRSLWQNGLMGVKVDRWIYWTKRRAEAVQFIDKAQSYAS